MLKSQMQLWHENNLEAVKIKDWIHLFTLKCLSSNIFDNKWKPLKIMEQVLMKLL